MGREIGGLLLLKQIYKGKNIRIYSRRIMWLRNKHYAW